MANASTSLMVRLDPDSKTFVARAAELRHVSVSDYVRSVMVAQARREIQAAAFPFVAVMLDCIDDRALSFYRHWDFRPLPGHRYRLFLSWNQLQALASGC